MAKDTKKAQPLDVFTCELDGISNIEASAGTGKTWAICGLYVRLIAEKGLTVDQVLVVTFTNAATAELRNRIRDRLVEMLHCLKTGRCLSEDAFALDYIKRLKNTGGDTACVFDRLKTALLSFEEASILTIHSFCQRMLGEVPFSAVQPFSVDVEADDDEIVKEVAADYWRRIVNRYTAEEISALMDKGVRPDWLSREIKRVLNKPTAKLLFSAMDPDEDRTARRANWIKRILLRTGPPVVRAAKRQRRIISYSDMLYNLYEALTSGRYIGLKNILRSRFPAALIDEFQDTDPLQFEIFNSIYTGSGILFTVGDPKQAIYSFRSADLNTYLVAKRNAQREWTLVHNQRSEDKLIEAFNAIFECNKNVFGNPEIPYRNVQRGTKPLKLLTGDPEPREPFSVWLFDPGSKKVPRQKGELEENALDATAREMVRLIEGGIQKQIKIGSDPLEPRHIAVLVRTKMQGRKVKDVLARYGIGSVDLTDRSVFDTLEAEEMQRILRSIAEPARSGLVRAALSTVLMGKGSMELAVINSDEAEFNRVTERMNQYRLLWLQYGFGTMWRKLMASENIIERLLPRAGGERTITNLMHLMELMTTAEEKHRGIESFMRWLDEKRSDIQEEEAAQLRLESDENLVQIVTKHRAKGLEWPIVFCPFIWSERIRSDSDDVYMYHESDELILDYTGDKRRKKKQEEEGREERVRLIYVALTRAINRCYITAGPFWKAHGRGATETDAPKSMMNWIVAGDEKNPGNWMDKRKDITVASIHQAWTKLLTSRRGVGLMPWSGQKKEVALSVSMPETTYKAREVVRLPEATWMVSSYSSLSASSREERKHIEKEPRDYDVAPGIEKDIIQENIADQNEGTLTEDIIDFPSGTTAGHCLHGVFEKIDFQDDSNWQNVISDLLAAYPPMDAGRNVKEQAAMIQGMLKNVLGTKLPGGFLLRDISCRKRISEMEFAYPVRHLKPHALKNLLDQYGLHVPKLEFPALKGYLRGFIDLVFEHAGKWYVLDWKSNKLGSMAQDYSRERLDEAMWHHNYELQGLIYLAALHRYLKLRIPAYDYQANIGGVLYLFVRGVRPAWPSAGIWHKLPELELIESMDALFSAE
jgi:exodeoxyribonuclease V beta subunit